MTARKKVLLICYYFPPLGGAGVSRPLTLYKNLPDYNIECDILTVKPVAYRYYEPELLEEETPGTIYRAGSTDPQRLMYLMGMRRIKDKLITQGKSITDRYFPDPKIGWVNKAIKLGRVLVENKHYDAIITTSPPMSSHLIGKKLAHEFKLPWLADFRDYWTAYKPENWFNSKDKIEKANQLIEDIKKASTKITTASLGISAYLEKGEVIYNSYNQSRSKLWQAPQENKIFQIGVLGTIDSLRPLKPLFELLSKLFIKKPQLKSEISIKHVGAINIDSFEELIKFYHMEEIFTSYGVKPRTETIKILNDVFLYYFGISKEFGEGIITSRLFDIFASGRPILAAVPEDYEAALLIKATSNSFIFDENNIEQGGAYLEKTIDALFQQKLLIKPLPEYAQLFSANKMTEKFVAILNDITKATT